MSNQVKAITKKSQDISSWYNDVIAQAKLAEHGPSKGSIIIRPKGFALWEKIQSIMDHKIKALGGVNAYFPLLIPYSFLEKEKSHVKGFSPELAVVTHGGGEELTEPLVVRPTSETVMYDAYSKWISSYRDLPMIINQWNNVIRWEKRPYLFLRTTEFLWQEGHSVHPTAQDNRKFMEDILKMYVDVYQDSLAIYGYAGRKSESERFAGADMTLTYEILAPDGKVIQGCTSHDLGQNFSKAFNVKFQDKNGKEEFAYQASWGFTTRSIGTMILVHGDDNGLVLPPMIAPLQVVIIPIVSKSGDQGKISQLANKAFEMLESYDIRVRIDNSDQSPGWKFNQYELEGVPIRVEIGATEAKNQTFRLVRRDTKESMEVALKDLGPKSEKLLEDIQKDLLEKSKKFTLENTREARNYPEFKEIMNTSRGFIEAFWCEDPNCEAMIKQETKATTRCLPLDAIETNGECIYCKKPAKFRWIFAQSY
ncbi:proline--tRNA ligase [Candidatus Daviesbacteria bacterium]|nr:proline--tRNA ligase [Candidatus Daviesbacteria bacterium]